MRLPQLRRVRWAVRATLTLGVAASVTANVLHAQQNPISQAIAAWPPLALLLTVELISRVPVDRRSLAFGRFAATAIIAGIAAWVSYWHMAGVASRYGETGASPYLLPLSVDGLIIVASICLVELAGRIAAADAAVERQRAAEAAARTEEEAQVRRAELEHQRAEAERERLEAERLRAEAERQRAETERQRTAAAVAAVGQLMPSTKAPSTVDGSRRAGRAAATPADAAAPRQRRPAAETAALAAAIEAVQPDASAADIARQLGISTSRLRSIRREMREYEPA